MKYTINTTSEEDVAYSQAANYEDNEKFIDSTLIHFICEYDEKGTIESQINIIIPLMSKIINNQQEEIRLLRLFLSKSGKG